MQGKAVETNENCLSKDGRPDGALDLAGLYVCRKRGEPVNPDKLVKRIEAALSPMERIAGKLEHLAGSFDAAMLQAARYLHIHAQERAGYTLAAKARLFQAGQVKDAQEAQKSADAWLQLAADLEEALQAQRPAEAEKGGL